MTKPELQDHLYYLEERLLHPDRERDRTALIPLFSQEYKEFCISGRIFNRQQVIDALANAMTPDMQAKLNQIFDISTASATKLAAAVNAPAQ